jgi:hypothetical protein
VAHVPPAVPQYWDVWLWQVVPLQQPLGHEVPSQMHAPKGQRCPETQAEQAAPAVPHIVADWLM